MSHDMLLLVLAMELTTITFGKKEMQKVTSIRSASSLYNYANDCPLQHTDIPLKNH